MRREASPPTATTRPNRTTQRRLPRLSAERFGSGERKEEEEKLAEAKRSETAP
ncbi:Uncharacterized protein DAT39_023712 [Clarias magur]|uniref:Uncharacterized protein n=1 Tax=Clarias magur TaxID=1594786 RepID=A0A8J4WMK3_CLAMG|nr:Uncharacterized protein DAT39_023712 [Clarias magur]